MSAIKKAVDVLWYSPVKKDRNLSREIAAEYTEMKNKIATLQAERDELRGALQVYANRANWGKWMATLSRVRQDEIVTWKGDNTGYEIARAALAKGEQK